MAGGFATGVSLIRSQWEAEGRPNDGTKNTVTYDGISMVLTNEDTANGIRPGYVVGLTDGATLGSGFDAANCEEIWNNMLQQPPVVTTTFSEVNTNSQVQYFVSQSGSGSSALCHFYLKESLAQGASGYTNPSNSTTVGNSFTYQPANSSVVVHIN